MTSGAAGVAAAAGAAGACGESGAGGPILQALSTAVVAAVKILSQKRRGEVSGVSVIGGMARPGFGFVVTGSLPGDWPWF